MSVLVTLWMRGDAAKFEQIAADTPDRIRSISERAKEHGAIGHRFYATEDGDIMVVDEWPDAESGVTSEPTVHVWRKLETGDDIGWGAA